MSEVTVVIGAGQIGQAIARRVSVGKQVLLRALRVVAQHAVLRNRRHRLILDRVTPCAEACPETCPEMPGMDPH